MKKWLSIFLFVLLFTLIHTAESTAAQDAKQLEGVWRGKVSGSVTYPDSPYPSILSYKNENFRITTTGNEVVIWLESTKQGAYHNGFGYKSGTAIFKLNYKYFDLKGTYFQKYNNPHGCNPAKNQQASGEVSSDWNTIEISFEATAGHPWAASATAPITACTHKDRIHGTLKLQRIA